MSQDTISTLARDLKDDANYAQRTGITLIIANDGQRTGGITETDFEQLKYELTDAVPNVSVLYVRR